MIWYEGVDWLGPAPCADQLDKYCLIKEEFYSPPIWSREYLKTIVARLLLFEQRVASCAHLS